MIPENKATSHVISVSNRQFNLKIDCENCFGLCCVALYFSTLEGFPTDKEAGKPCYNLQADFSCCVHNNLFERGLKGCVAFDCFGAGQKVAQVTFKGQDWRKVPESTESMFKVFLIMRQLHELLWYLTEALTFKVAYPIHGSIESLIIETEMITHLSSEKLLKLDVAQHRSKVDRVLVKASKLVRDEAHREWKSTLKNKKSIGKRTDFIGVDLRKANLIGENLRGAYFIAANLSGVDCNGTDFIGADLRDADVRGTDFSKSIFLTQAQMNVAKGDISTKLPSSLSRPKHW